MRKLLSKLFSKKKKDENHNHGKNNHSNHNHKHLDKKWELIDDLIEDYNSNDWTY
jgi:hypothetical protein